MIVAVLTSKLQKLSIINVCFLMSRVLLGLCKDSGQE